MHARKTAVAPVKPAQAAINNVATGKKEAAPAQ
jgi:hypothetical protein